MKEKQIIHHEPEYDGDGNVTEEAFDEVFEIEEDADIELLRQCILELADIIYA